MMHDYFTTGEQLLRDAELGCDSPTARGQHVLLLRRYAQEPGISLAERERAEDLANRLTASRPGPWWMGQSLNTVREVF